MPPFSYAEPTVQINGTTITGGTPGRVLFVGTTGTLDDDAGLSYTASNAALAVSGTTTAGAATLLNLTAGRVPFVDNTKQLADSSGLAFNSTTGALTVTSINAQSATFSGLTTTRVPYMTTGGQLKDEAAFFYTEASDLLTVGILGLTLGQIAFPATQVASAGANVLDDYERGSWTPSVVGSGGGTPGAYNARYGRYIKIGSMVFARCRVNIMGPNTLAGNISITGFPFTALNDNASHNAGTCETENLTYPAGTTIIQLLVMFNTAIGLSYGSGSGIAPAPNVAGDIGVNCQWDCNMVYEATS